MHRNYKKAFSHSSKKPNAIKTLDRGGRAVGSSIAIQPCGTVGATQASVLEITDGSTEKNFQSVMVVTLALVPTSNYSERVSAR